MPGGICVVRSIGLFGALIVSLATAVSAAGWFSCSWAQTTDAEQALDPGLTITIGEDSAARTIRDMPLRWRQSLSGERPPNLTKTRLRARSCHLWQTASLTSKLAMVGASVALRVRPVRIDRDERPPILSRCPGVVARAPWFTPPRRSEEPECYRFLVPRFGDLGTDALAGNQDHPVRVAHHRTIADCEDPLPLGERPAVVTTACS